LIDDNDFLFKNAEQGSNTFQNNCHDCGLFAMGSVLHLALGEPLDVDTYSQDNINHLQESLYTVFSVEQKELEYFSDPKERLSQSFLYYFFPYIADDNKTDQYINGQ
jgi:hypothetical protein